MWRRTANALSHCTKELPCVRTNMEVRFCRSESCSTQGGPINGSYSAWSHWSGCSKPCGKGIKERFRTCNNPAPANGGVDCRGLDEAIERRSCSKRRCPVNGGYTKWSGWSSCSKSCKGGTQHRSRACSNPSPSYGGKGCWGLGPNTQTRDCNTYQCPGHLFSLKLILYGTKEDPLAKNPHVDRRKKAIRNVNINARKRDIPLHGGYTHWSDWDSCSKSCGEGMQISTRSCKNPEPANRGRDCRGPARKTRKCNMISCPGVPINGGFSAWSLWSRCTKSCGGGSRQRSRNCTNPPPANGGTNCRELGEAIEKQTCSIHGCPAIVTSGSCRDRMGEKFCAMWKSFCKNIENFRRKCAKTCGKCNV